MLALYGVVRFVNCCHLNIAHCNVECRMQAYNGTFAESVWSVTPATLRLYPLPWSESLDKSLYIGYLAWKVQISLQLSWRTMSQLKQKTIKLNTTVGV